MPVTSRRVRKERRIKRENTLLRRALVAKSQDHQTAVSIARGLFAVEEGRRRYEAESGQDGLWDTANPPMPDDGNADAMSVTWGTETVNGNLPAAPGTSLAPVGDTRPLQDVLAECDQELMQAEIDMWNKVNMDAAARMDAEFAHQESVAGDTIIWGTE